MGWLEDLGNAVASGVAVVADTVETVVETVTDTTENVVDAGTDRQRRLCRRLPEHQWRRHCWSGIVSGAIGDEASQRDQADLAMRKVDPGYVSKMVMAHEMGHYFGLCHINHKRRAEHHVLDRRRQQRLGLGAVRLIT